MRRAISSRWKDCFYQISRDLETREALHPVTRCDRALGKGHFPSLAGARATQCARTEEAGVGGSAAVGAWPPWSTCLARCVVYLLSCSSYHLIGTPIHRAKGWTQFVACPVVWLDLLVPKEGSWRRSGYLQRYHITLPLKCRGYSSTWTILYL